MTHKASSARRHAAKKRDAEFAAKAGDALAAPDLGRKITGLVGVVSNHLLTYSVRNLALLMAQADERGMTITDVRSYKSWQLAGRQVRRGEKSLRIVKPVTRRIGADEDELDADEFAGPALLFRTAAVFDISQTDPIPTDEEDGDEEAAEDDDPAEVLLESLIEQADTHGYRVEFDPAGKPGAHLGRGHTIIVRGDRAEALPDLANVLAGLALERDREREKRRAERDARRSGRTPEPRNRDGADEPLTLTIT